MITITRNACLVLLCAAIVSACTTLTPVAVSPSDAQQQIVSGELLKPGNRVRLITTDGYSHDLTVSTVDAANGTVNGTFRGRASSVRVADIVTVEKSRLAVGKTIGLAVGIVTGLQIGAFIAEFGSIGL